jgi:hypothetical protein
MDFAEAVNTDITPPFVSLVLYWVGSFLSKSVGAFGCAQNVSGKFVSAPVM